MTDVQPDERLGDAARQLVPLLYEDMRRMARQQRGRFSPGQTLQTTALVNEAYLKLVHVPSWNDHQHFLRSASVAMRHIITDMARAKLRHKRGDGAHTVPLDEEAMQVADRLWPDGGEDRVVELDEALGRLAALSPRLAQIVECRFFAGYSEVETAEALGISERTMRRDWTKARAWLYRELGTDLA